MTNRTSIYVSAAGKGTRMGSLTLDTPKPLLKICGKPFISYLLEYISENMNTLFTDCIVSYGYLGDRWKPIIGKYSDIVFTNCDITLPVVSQFLSTAHKFAEDNIVAISGDIFCDPTIIRDIIESHYSNSADVTVAICKCSKTNWKSWEYVVQDNKLLDIRKNEYPNNIERYCIIVSKKALKGFTCDFSINMGKSDDEFLPYLLYNKGWTYLIKRMLDANYSVNIVESDKYLFNINSPENLQQATTFVMSRE